MIYQFTGISNKTVTIADEAQALELIAALEDGEFVTTFDPASNGSEFVYRSPEEQEKDQCYTAWGYQ